MNVQPRTPDRSLMGPVILILIGTVFLLRNFIPDLDFGMLWPVGLIAVGVVGLIQRHG